MEERKLAILLLRFGISFSLLYAAIASLLEPTSWIGFFPMFLRSLPIPDALLLNGFSVVQVGVASWLLWGKRLFWPSLLSALMFAAITLVNVGAMDIVFRDLGLFFAALALLALRE